MLFCFHAFDILFLDKEYTVVDKITLNAWRLSYTPKKAAKYVIEASKGTFKKIQIGEKIQVKT